MSAISAEPEVDFHNYATSGDQCVKFQHDWQCAAKLLMAFCVRISGAFINRTPHKGRAPNCSKFGEAILLRFETRARQNRLKSTTEAKLCTPLEKIRGGIGKKLQVRKKRTAVKHIVVKFELYELYFWLELYEL